MPSHPAGSASDHYSGDGAKAYFEHAGQARWQTLSPAMNLRHWREHVTPHDDVLDFGCGSGGLLQALSAAPGAARIGVDINPFARDAASRLGIQVHADLDTLRGRHFTKIISSHALEHVEDPVPVLTCLRELLSPGGRLLLMLPLGDWRASGERRYRPDDEDRHLFSWTPQTLGNLLSVSGFRPERILIVPDTPSLRSGFVSSSGLSHRGPSTTRRP